MYTCVNTHLRLYIAVPSLFKYLLFYLIISPLLLDTLLDYFNFFATIAVYLKTFTSHNNRLES